MTLSEELNSNIDEPIDNDLELLNLKNAILGNKKLIFYFTLIGLSLGFLFGIQKQTWKGEFQIVLDNKSDNLSSRLGSLVSGNYNQMLGSLLNQRGVSNALKTEIEILKSPSILIDIFEFVKNQPTYKENSNKKLLYKDWRKRFDFELLKQTSVLSISYVSQEKENIIPVLNRISNKYQQYSGKKELKMVNSAINFLDKQIKKYTDKSAQSVNKAQEFALKYDFGISPIFLPNPNQILKDFPNPEAVRVKSLNQLRLINNQLDKIKENKIDDDEIFYIAQQPFLSKNDLPEIIKNSDRLKIELAQKRIVYNEDDIVIKKLIDLVKSSNNEIKINLIGALNAKKIQLETLLEASSRPDGVLIEYLELMSQAKEELKTLEQLKIQSRVLSLQKEKSKEPWELITEPTLLPNPIAPKKLRLMAAGIFLGFISGCGFARFKEGKKNLILNRNQFINLSKWDFLCELKINNWESSSETLKCLALGKLSNSKKNISIIKVGNFDNQILENVLEELNIHLQDKEIKIFKDINEAIKFGEIVPIAFINTSSVIDLETIKQNLSLQNLKVLGSILIN